MLRVSIIWSYSGIAEKCIFTEIKMLFLYTISLRQLCFICCNQFLKSQMEKATEVLENRNVILNYPIKLEEEGGKKKIRREKCHALFPL